MRINLEMILNQTALLVCPVLTVRASTCTEHSVEGCCKFIGPNQSIACRRHIKQFES